MTASFTSYTNDGFGDKDQKALYKTFNKLDRKGCKIMLSNSHTLFIRELYGELNEYTNQVNVLRAINSKATNRTGHTELIVRNYEKKSNSDLIMMKMIMIMILPLSEQQLSDDEINSHTTLFSLL